VSVLITFIAVYRGETIADARLIATSVDPALVAEVSSKLLADRAAADQSADPAIAAIERGRRSALRVIKAEATR